MQKETLYHTCRQAAHDLAESHVCTLHRIVMAVAKLCEAPGSMWLHARSLQQLVQLTAHLLKAMPADMSQAMPYSLLQVSYQGMAHPFPRDKAQPTASMSPTQSVGRDFWSLSIPLQHYVTMFCVYHRVCLRRLHRAIHEAISKPWVHLFIVMI